MAWRGPRGSKPAISCRASPRSAVHGMAPAISTAIEDCSGTRRPANETQLQNPYIARLGMRRTLLARSLAARFCDEQDVFKGFANAQFLRDQDDSRTAAIASAFAEVIGHGGDIVAYKDPSLVGRDSGATALPETGNSARLWPRGSGPEPGLGASDWWKAMTDEEVEDFFEGR